MKKIFIIIFLVIFNLVFISCNKFENSDLLQGAAIDFILEDTVGNFSKTIFTRVGLPTSLNNFTTNTSTCSDGTSGTPYISTSPIEQNCEDGGTSTILSYNYCDTADNPVDDYIISFKASADACQKEISLEDCNSDSLYLKISGDFDYSYNNSTKIARISGKAVITVGDLNKKSCEFNVTMQNINSDDESFSGTICDLKVEDLENLDDEDVCEILLSEGGV